MSTPTVLHRLATGSVLLATVLMPLWFLPLDGDAFSAHKQILFTAFALFLGVLWVVNTFRTQRVVFTFTPLTLAFLLLTLATAASAFLAPNRPAQFSGRFLLLSSMTFFVLFGTPLATGLRWRQVLRGLLFACLVAAGVFVWQLTPWPLTSLLNQALKTHLDTSAAFTLFESPAMFFALGVPVFIASLVTWWQDQQHTGPAKKQAWYWFAGAGVVGLSLVGLAVVLWRDASLRPILLPYSFGWGIAVENFKQLTRGLFGLGPEEFLTGFHRFRDVTFNSSPYWTLRFRASSSEAFQVLSTTGILGFLSWLSLFGVSLWTARHVLKREPSLVLFLVLLTVLFWLVPFSTLLLGVLAILLLTLTQEARQDHPAFAKDLIITLSAIQLAPAGEVKTVRTHKPFAFGMSLTVLALLIGFGYWSGKIYAAKVAYALSLRAAANNQATQTYDLQQKAIRLDPTNTQYRRAYSATNLAIARALAQRGDLSEEQRQTFAQLIQQSIREGRLAAQLNPQETESWENLATLYSNMLDIEGAPTWASAALIQAIQTDPISPQLRSQIGQLYVELDQASQSLRFFEQAIQLKPDWATAYYRYGIALEEVGQPAIAHQAYQRALSLLTNEDPDYSVVQEKVRSSEQAAKNAEEAQKAAKPSASPTPTPSASPNPGVFNTQDPTIPSESPQPSPVPTGDPNFVLPENVGF